MARIEKTVFISYRRKDISWALAVYQYLTNQNYDVFFDYSSIPSGDFEQIIISNIRARAHFILILTPTALDRCSEPGDWLRREIETAMDEKRNIIPLFFDGFDFGSPNVAEKLIGKFADVKRYNGLDIPSGYFLEAMERLRTRYLNIPLNAVIHPVSTEVRKVIKNEKSAVDKALREHKSEIKELVKPAREKSQKPKLISTSTRRIFKNRIVFVISVLAFTLIVFSGINYFFNIKNRKKASNPTATPPINDNFASAKLINSLPFTDILDTTGATQDIADPENVLCEYYPGYRNLYRGENTVWYTYTNGTGAEQSITVDTKGTTNYDTYIAVWTGTQDNLTFVGCSDEDYYADAVYTFVAFDKVPYYIEVAHYTGIYSESALPNRGGGGTLQFNVYIANIDAIIGTDLAPTKASELSIGSTMTGKDGMTMLYVPAGEFTMGSEGGDGDEKPVRRILLDTFWIDETEVTNAMYAVCVEAGVCNEPSKKSSSTRNNYYGKSEFDNYPVIYVSWDDASAYCSWADRRLPTEAEWEKAADWNANNQTKSIYSSGDSISCSVANYFDINGSGYCAGDTTEVDRHINNGSPYLALDMTGNVWEWVNDWYNENYYRNSPSYNPNGPDTGQFRVLRGGSWANNDYVARSANRFYSAPMDADEYIGFRCASDVSP